MVLTSVTQRNRAPQVALPMWLLTDDGGVLEEPMNCFPDQAANRDSSTECRSQGESKTGSCPGHAAHQAEVGWWPGRSRQKVQQRGLAAGCMVERVGSQNKQFGGPWLIITGPLWAWVSLFVRWSDSRFHRFHKSRLFTFQRVWNQNASYDQ